MWISHKYPEQRAKNTKLQEQVNLDDVVYVTPVYENLFFWAEQWPIVACIAKAPLNNEPSLRFHEKHGFREIGTVTMHDYLGFDTYQAGVYVSYPR